MKEGYLDALRKALENEGLDNVDEIILKYANRFDLGYEAGMDDEEIISMLEDIDEIIAKCKKKTTKEGKEVNIELDLAIFEDFEIVLSKDSGVSFEFDDKAYQYVDVVKKDELISLKNNKKFKVKGRYSGRMTIGHNININNFKLQIFSCDLNCCEIEAKNISVQSTSGDCDFDILKGRECVKISSISGNMNINKLEGNIINLSMVSGDMYIKEIEGKINISTVSGDVKITYATAMSTFKISSISGDIIISSGADFNKVSASSVSGNIKICGSKVRKTVVDEIDDELHNMENTFKKIII